MSLTAQIAIALGSILALIGTWFAGKRKGTRETIKTVNLEQRANQVEILRTDVQIDANATEARRELEAQPMPKPPLTREEAKVVLARLRKKFGGEG